MLTRSFHKVTICCLLLAAVLPITVQAADLSPAAISVDSADWPWWRGPARNGTDEDGQLPPLNWSETENVLWHQQIPGRGHGSPTIVGDQVFLAIADDQRATQGVLCIDRRTGGVLWNTEVHSGGLEAKLNAKASHASTTIASDGRLLFVNFLNGGAVYTTALTRDGAQVWQEKISDYIVHQGYGSSPALYESLVIVSADNKGGGAVVAMDRATGKRVWKVERPRKPNYASPIILEVAGRPQLLFIGCNLVSSFDPLTGEQLWETDGATTECVTSTVTDGQLIFTSGGYPKNHVSAVRGDGSGELVWEAKDRVYVPSMLIREGYLYGVLDAGVAICWDCKTGKAVWRGRLSGNFSASPVMIGDHIFATNENGQTSVFRADSRKLEIVATNQLGDHAMATPTICGGRIYFRVAKQNGDERQEMLFCVGE